MVILQHDVPPTKPRIASGSFVAMLVPPSLFTDTHEKNKKENICFDFIGTLKKRHLPQNDFDSLGDVGGAKENSVTQ